MSIKYIQTHSNPRLFYPTNEQAKITRVMESTHGSTRYISNRGFIVQCNSGQCKFDHFLKRITYGYLNTAG